MLNGGGLSAPASGPVDASLKGVRGWLLFLCISWTILYPAVIAVIVGQTIRDIATFRYYADLLPLLVPALVIDSSLAVIVGGLSLLAGIRLWRVLPGAVRTARIFLVANVAYQIISAALPYFAMPAQIIGMVDSNVVTGLIRAILWTAVWFAYFSRSRRVAATYATTG